MLGCLSTLPGPGRIGGLPLIVYRGEEGGGKVPKGGKGKKNPKNWETKIQLFLFAIRSLFFCFFLFLGLSLSLRNKPLGQNVPSVQLWARNHSLSRSNPSGHALLVDRQASPPSAAAAALSPPPPFQKKYLQPSFATVRPVRIKKKNSSMQVTSFFIQSQVVDGRHEV